MDMGAYTFALTLTMNSLCHATQVSYKNQETFLEFPFFLSHNQPNNLAQW